MHLNAVIIENTIYLLLKGCVSSLVLQNLPVFSLGLNILKALNSQSLYPTTGSIGPLALSHFKCVGELLMTSSLGETEAWVTMDACR